MHSFFYSDRIRTTNNMLGDCYAAAIVEQLSRKELTALDAIYQESPRSSTNRNIVGQTVQPKEVVTIDMYNSTNSRK